MYYHCLSLKHVRCGKIYPYDSQDPWFANCYKWIGKYCGYCPQIWLSRSHSQITGIRSDKNFVLFGFEDVVGFPIDYDWWCLILNVIINFHLSGKDVEKDFDRLNVKIWEEVQELYAEDTDDELSKADDFDSWMSNCLLIKNNQVVVPSLNLKSAKEVFCRNEKQKKKLRKMGFIEDRIKIRNFSKSAW